MDKVMTILAILAIAAAVGAVGLLTSMSFVQEAEAASSQTVDKAGKINTSSPKSFEKASARNFNQHSHD